MTPTQQPAIYRIVAIARRFGLGSIRKQSKLWTASTNITQNYGLQLLYQLLNMSIFIVAYVVHSLMCTCSIVSNILLILCIISHTPAAMRSYSVLLFSLSTLEMTTSTMSLLLFQRIIPYGESVFLVSSGPISLLNSRRLCHVMYAVMLHGYAHYVIMMAMLFCFRYYVLIFPTPRPRNVAFVCITVYIPSVVVYGALASSDMASENDILFILKNQLGYDLRGEMVTGYMYIFDPRVLTAIIWVCVPSVPFACLAVSLSARINHILRKNSICMSDNTRTMHRELVQALMIQASLAVMCVISVMAYVCGQLNIIHEPLLEYTTHIVGEICLASSPLVTIYYVRTYRRSITSLTLFTRRSSRINSLTLTQPGESNAPSKSYVS